MPIHVIKRDGRSEPFDVSHIQKRIENLSDGLDSLDIAALIAATLRGCTNGVHTSELDEITARAAADKCALHSDYAELAARIIVSNMHKQTPQTFTESAAAIHAAGYLSDETARYIAKYGDQLNAMINNQGDYQYSYLALCVLRSGYLYSSGGKLIDRPQYALMRVAVAFSRDLASTKRTYEALSALRYTHGTSTYVNAGSKMQQLLNCFLLRVGDSTEEITRAMTDSAWISRGSGGLGVSLDDIRGAGQIIQSTGGKAAGAVRFAKIFGEIAQTWNQGGRRDGAFAIYISIFHADVLGIIRLGDPSTPSDLRADNLFRGIMLCDLFLQRWREGGTWSFFSPDTARGLVDVYDGMRVCAVCGFCPNPNYAKYIRGAYAPKCAQCKYVRTAAFSELYARYESVAVATMPAKAVMDAIAAISPKKMPYLLNRDVINRRSNQDNAGTVIQSNLCAEIVELTTDNSIACCTLASIALQKFVKGTQYDWKGLMQTARIATRNLDRAIDINHYPAASSGENNRRFRPLGLGVQGLADVFQAMRLPYLSPEAEQLDMLIHEAIYFACLEESCELARLYGAYDYYSGSPISEGILQMDYAMEETGIDHCGWKLVDGKTMLGDTFPIGTPQWTELRKKIAKHGIRNVYLRANMPTVNTGDILGSVGPSTEPINMNVFMKTTVGSLKITKYNPYLVKHAEELGLWNEDVAMVLAKNGGKCPESFPRDFRQIYLTAYEMKPS
jgi:ribonucleoside-diphosphate reductase alpha subunit